MGIPFQKKTWTNWVDDIDEDEMNRIEEGILGAYGVLLIAVSDTAPAYCDEGDKYYNTEDDLIYTATDVDRWGEEGETPKEGTPYIVVSERKIYLLNTNTEKLTVISSDPDLSNYIQQDQNGDVDILGVLSLNGVPIAWVEEEEEENEES